MRSKINQEINIDNIEEYIYNNSKIAKFTYEDFIKYEQEYHPEDKIEENNNLLVLKEKEEKYECKKVNNEHDKIFRTILDDKKEAVAFINKTLNLKLKEEDIEKYKENYITEELINNQTDIVYKVKSRKVFILIEHQTKIDYSMPYRIIEYKYKIIKSAIDIKKIKQKEYKIPTVIAIVLYTGKIKWNVEQYIEEKQERLYKYQKEEIGKYVLVDVNDYKEEELLKEKTLLSKVMLIESKKDTEEIIKCVEKTIEILNKDKKIYTPKQKEILAIMLNLTLRRKINNNEITDKLIKKLKNEGGEEMLAIFDTIDEENKRILNQGRKEGLKEGKKEGRQEGQQEEKRKVAKRMKKDGMLIDRIVKFTGLTKKQIEEL